MVSKTNKPDKRLEGEAATKHGVTKVKPPTLAQCRSLVGGNLYHALVLQKICHYCHKSPFEIDGNRYSAPTTDMIINELGVSRSTVQKAISELEQASLIEVRRKHFRRSPRRYVRVLCNPSDPAVSTEHDDNSCPSTGAHGEPAEAETITTSALDTVHNKEEEKEKNQSNQLACTHGLVPHEKEKGAGSQEVACGPGFSGESNPHPSKVSSPEEWKPRGLFERIELQKALEEAKRAAFNMTETIGKRRGWEHLRRKYWNERLVARMTREFHRRKLAEQKDKTNPQ